MPFFSVIIPTFNRDGFVQEAINSVFQQSFDDFEIIVVDDGSDDNTEKTLRSFSDKRFCYVRQNNKGVSYARNCGLNIAEGKFICFLDSDDLWKEDKLLRTYETIGHNSDIKIFHTQEVWYKNNEIVEQHKKHRKPCGDAYSALVDICNIGMSTVVMDRSIFDIIGNFDEDLEACEDYDFWLRITCQYPVYLIDEVLTIKRGGHSDQLSQNIWGLDRFRIQALHKILQSNRLSEEQMFLTKKSILEKCHIFLKGLRKRGRVDEINYYEGICSTYYV